MMFSLGALVAEGFGPLGTCRSLQIHASLLVLSSIAPCLAFLGPTGPQKSVT